MRNSETVFRIGIRDEFMKIQKIRIEDIRPYGNNAKLHPISQIEQIKKSILEFGNNDPIAIDENNMIIEGHGRYQALRELGCKEVEVIRLKHLSEEQKRAYILVHNKLTMNTGFDFDVLSEELKKIKSIDLGCFNFDDELVEDDEETEEEHEFKQMVFEFNIEQYKLIEKILNATNEITFDTFENKHKNGNKIYEVVRRWAEQKKLS